MRKISGLLLISVGVVVLSIYATVRWRLPLSDAVIHRIAADEVIVYIDPVVAPACGGVALLAGLALLRKKTIGRDGETS